MKTFFGFPGPASALDAPVLTIGMFDGVHRGHQAVLTALLNESRRLNAPAVVLTFDRHPRTVVTPEDTPPMITTLEHRLALFAEAGVDAAIVLPFNGELAEMTGRVFVERIMCQRLGMQGVVMGHDTHFGKKRSGNVQLLEEMVSEKNISVVDIPPYQIGGTIVSSTLIREAVQAGELDRAAEMLGYAVTVMGTVVHGQGFGRQLGFPTLNLDLHHELHPPQGVYVTKTRIGDSEWPSVTFIGSQPAGRKTEKRSEIIECHLLKSGIGNLYGTVATVSFIRFLRAVQHFDSSEALSAAITADTVAAQNVHAELNNPPNPNQ